MSAANTVHSSSLEGRLALKYAHERLAEMLVLGSASAPVKQISHLTAPVERRDFPREVAQASLPSRHSWVLTAAPSHTLVGSVTNTRV